jgi:hypothetical protein
LEKEPNSKIKNSQKSKNECVVHQPVQKAAKIDARGPISRRIIQEQLATLESDKLSPFDETIDCTRNSPKKEFGNLPEEETH